MTGVQTCALPICYSEALKVFNNIREEKLNAHQRLEYDYKKGYCLLKRNKTDEAMALFREVMNTKSLYAVPAAYYYGYTQYELGNYDGALKAFSLIKDDPRFRQTIPIYLMYIYYRQTAYNKVVEPAGKQITFGDPELENHALDCALSPNGKTLAVEGRYRVVFINTRTNQIESEIKLRNYKKYRKFLNTLSGITWSKNGKSVFWSADDKRSGSVVFQIEWDGRGKAKLLQDKTIWFRGQKKKDGHFLTAIPNEMVIDGSALYVVLNGNNQVVKLDLNNRNRPVWTTTVGVAPYGIVKANGKLYVTNWGGVQPRAGDLVAGTPWDPAVVDSLTGAVSNGSVSVLEPATGKVLAEIQVGLHPNDIAASPDGKFVYTANGNSDDVSVISTETNRVTETIPVILLGKKSKFVGDSPNGLAISGDGSTLYVANGMDNALAVVRLGRRASGSGTAAESVVSGFIPTEAYPGNVALSKDGSTLYVANI